MALTCKAFGDIITFTRTSSATFTGSNGLIQSAAIDAPRFDYDPVTLAAKGLLIEEQRTNLLTYSEDFTNVVWNKSNASVTANAAVSPDGATNADKLVENTATSTHSVSVTLIAGSAVYTYSVYVKAAGRSVIRFRDSVNGVDGYFDLTTASSPSGTAVNRTITDVGNGWYRCSMTSSAAVTNPEFGLRLATAVGTENYTGDGVSGVFLYGSQVEAGSFPTSYIPTVASQVTRSADVASVNTLSPWYNAAEGTIFADYEQNSSTQSGGSLFVQSDGTNNNRILLTADGASSGTIQPGLYVTDASVPQVAIVAGTGTVNSLNKIAAAYKANDFAASFNGAAAVPDTSGTVPVVNLAYIGVGATGTSGHINGHIRRITYYPRRLSNAELQAITA